MTPPRPSSSPPSAATAEPVVFVVDDDRAARESLSWLIGSIHLRVAAFASAAEFLAACPPGQPGCLITDVRMPGLSGLDLQAELKRRGIEIPVIVVTGHGDVPMAVRAMKAGALDFVEKPFNDQILIDLVQKTVEKSLSATRAQVERRDIRARLEQLTPRERQVLDMIAAGESNKGIAHALGISEKTVEAHRAHVMDKMQARSLAELMKLVIALD
ncbi:MAG: response regulator transcription factor [Rhodospirillales bacterium]|nr:response regulator transcription factor [Rhodospirillales bacterium]